MSVTSAAWLLARFELQAGPVEVLRWVEGKLLGMGIVDRHPRAQPWAESWWATEPWATVVRFSPEGRFVVATTSDEPMRRVVLTRKELPRLRADLLDTDPERLASVQRFLGRWGLLRVRHALGRVADKSSPWFTLGSDDVAQTRAWLRLLRHCLEAPAKRLPKVWRALRAEGTELHGRLTVRWGRHGPPEPHVEVSGLLDALLLALPLWAEEGPPRPCARCGRLIPSPRRNQDYCGPACATALRVRRFRQRARVRGRLAAGDTDRMILARYPVVDPADLRRWRREWQPVTRGRRQRAAAPRRSTGRRPKGAR